VSPYVHLSSGPDTYPTFALDPERTSVRGTGSNA